MKTRGVFMCGALLPRTSYPELPVAHKGERRYQLEISHPEHTRPTFWKANTDDSGIADSAIPNLHRWKRVEVCTHSDTLVWESDTGAPFRPETEPFDIFDTKDS